MVLVVTVPGSFCCFSVTRAEAALAGVVSGIVLKVTVSAGGGTALERIFLLEDSSSVEVTRFRF